MKNIDEAYEQAKHQTEIEGFTLTEEDEKDIKAVARGEKTIEELIEDLKKSP